MEQINDVISYQFLIENVSKLLKRSIDQKPKCYIHIHLYLDNTIPLMFHIQKSKIYIYIYLVEVFVFTKLFP